MLIDLNYKLYYLLAAARPELACICVWMLALYSLWMQLANQPRVSWQFSSTLAFCPNMVPFGSKKLKKPKLRISAQPKSRYLPTSRLCIRLEEQQTYAS